MSPLNSSLKTWYLLLFLQRYCIYIICSVAYTETEEPIQTTENAGSQAESFTFVLFQSCKNWVICHFKLYNLMWPDLQ